MSSPHQKAHSPQTTWRRKRSDVGFLASRVAQSSELLDVGFKGGRVLAERQFLTFLKIIFAPKSIWAVALSQFRKLVCMWEKMMAKSSLFLQIPGGSNFQISRSSYFPARFISWDSVAATEIISDRKLLPCSHLVMAAAGTRLKEDFFGRRFLHIDCLTSPPLSLSFPSSIDIWHLDFETGGWTDVRGHKEGFCVE